MDEKICINCIYCLKTRTGHPIAESYNYWCTAKETIKKDIISGVNYIEGRKSCREMRDDPLHCGPEGRWWIERH